MGGGLMQLVAYGAQDVYLSGNPQITFFKVVYRRHTNFSCEPIQQTWNGAPDFGRTVTCNINRNGDLITNMYVSVLLNEMPASQTAWGYVCRLGHAMIDNVRIEIGGSKIDEQYGDWLNIWYELTHKVGQERGYANMIGDVDSLKQISTSAKRAYQLYIPLQFWFCRNDGLALPLIALQYHDVRITVVFRKAIECINWMGATSAPPAVLPSMQDSYLLIDYVYLDVEERKRFAQATHEYLIEQLQFTGSESLANSSKFRLNFNHPSKYLVWAPHLERYSTRSEWLAYSPTGSDWNTAIDRFAKLLFVASRNDVQLDMPATGTHTVTFDSVLDTELTPGSAASSVGDLFTFATPSSTVNTAVSDLLAKIDVRNVLAADRVSNAAAVVASVPHTESVLDSLLLNTIVTRNELTVEDISKNLSLFEGLEADIVNLARVSAINYSNYGNFIDGSDNPVYSAKLQLNGHDRFQSRDGHYFNYVQPFQHFCNTPCDGVNVYSFALKAEDHQPTGTCNFSRIDNATLQVELGLHNRSPPKDSQYSSTYISSGSLLNIYTMNYNVLRIMSGMGGLAYSN